MMLRFVEVLLLPLLVLGDIHFPLDCEDLFSHGKTDSEVYTIFPNGISFPVNVYCDMGCENDKDEGAGWTVFQRRMDGTVNFYRPWQQYKEGFGDASGEYWLGLEMLYLLTRKKNYELRVDMEDFEGNRVFAKYSTFAVGPGDQYKLTISGFTNGGAGDSLSGHNDMKFSTFDKDQDPSSSNCAALFLGGYWYGDCHSSNPNGVYLWGAASHYALGVNWYAFKGHRYSLKSITMKIKPVVA
ncbi:microfibril-associated glycoprotein 4-like [Engraulis encrasicolus]|uniref:microfibril-associated glycoprotein 4-like n=1 Tax=Engraulis encrasicolus TaxID=184585 RepID=UPI002FD088E0